MWTWRLVWPRSLPREQRGRRGAGRGGGRAPRDKHTGIRHQPHKAGLSVARGTEKTRPASIVLTGWLRSKLCQCQPTPWTVTACLVANTKPFSFILLLSLPD